jgi:hypothetical protein
MYELHRLNEAAADACPVQVLLEVFTLARAGPSRTLVETVEAIRSRHAGTLTTQDEIALDGLLQTQ